MPPSGYARRHSLFLHACFHRVALITITKKCSLCLLHPPNQHTSQSSNREPSSTSMRSRRNFVSICIFVPGLLRNFRRCFVCLSPRHHQGRLCWRQILSLNMDREALVSDLSDDGRQPEFLFSRFWKWQHVFLAVLHSTTHPSGSRPKASLRPEAMQAILDFLRGARLDFAAL